MHISIFSNQISMRYINPQDQRRPYKTIYLINEKARWIKPTADCNKLRYIGQNIRKSYIQKSKVIIQPDKVK